MLLDFKNHVAIKTSGRFVPLSAKGEAPEIKSPSFQKWGNVNMYRTSYNDMSNTVSQSNRFKMHHSILFCIKMVHVLIV